MGNRNLLNALGGLLAGWILALTPMNLGAQPVDADQPPSFGRPAGGLLGFGAAPASPKPTFEAGFTTPTADGSAQLFVKGKLPPGAHIYSITQAPGGPIRSEIKIKPPQGAELGQFLAVTTPHREINEEAFPGLPLESHSGSFSWVAPIRFAAGVPPQGIKFDGTVYAQVCDDNGCTAPQDYAFTVMYHPEAKLIALAAASQPAKVDPPKPQLVKPQLVNPQPPTVQPDGPTVTGPTVTGPTVIGPPIVKPQVAAHRDELTWHKFSTIAAFRTLVGPTLDLEQVRTHVRNGTQLSVWKAILLGFLGGLILNVMPCVLPVIGLKILSFVEQSGQSRQKAFMLNIWYSLGLLAVFLILALLATGPQKFGWGQLFGETWFTIALTAVVFTMALSFIGVWEVALPSFVGRGKANELAAQEGAVGAFFKGAMTTLLATPCSAPLLAPALAWATAQPPWLTYVVFLSIGLGMASPYLLIGAFPELLRFLPKPGLWMETFKKLMGFVLMATVVYMLTILQPQYVVPTVGLLFGLWFACWWIGRLSPVEELGVYLRTWAFATAFACLVWIAMFPGIGSNVLGPLGFDGLARVMEQRFASGPQTEKNEIDLNAIGPKTVLVDFTADWCLTCKVQENAVLRTQPVIDAVQRLGVVPLKADWTYREKAQEVTEMLDVLGSRQIPVIAVFSARDPNHPKILQAGYTQADVVEALEKAGPSPTPQSAGIAAQRL